MGFGGFCPLPLRLGGSKLEGWSPEQHARAAADLLAITRTAPFAVLQANSGTNEALAYQAMYGVGLTFAPEITSNAAGDVNVVWEAAYTDEYNGFFPVRIRHVKATIVTVGGFGTGWVANAVITTPREVRVRTRRDNGNLTASGFCLTVW